LPSSNNHVIRWAGKRNGELVRRSLWPRQSADQEDRNISLGDPEFTSHQGSSGNSPQLKTSSKKQTPKAADAGPLQAAR